MKYTPLDNIGLPIYKEDGTLSTINAPGNNYPSNDLGIPKSQLVKSKEKNIILQGIYEENEVTYPLLNPVDADVKSIPSTTFGFLIKDISTQQLYASEKVYGDLIKAYEENNPWYTIYTVPTINLDIKYLADYHKVNKFKITELYTEVEITSTLDTEEEILQYIDWLVKPSINTKDIELKPTEELGSWNLINDSQIGLGYKEVYDSMLKDKNPDPEAIGDVPTSATYDLSLPPITQVETKFQPIPEEQIVPKLIEAIMDVKEPPGQPHYNPFGGGLTKWLVGAAAIAISIASAGTALPFVTAAIASVAGTAAVVSSVAATVTGLASLIERKTDGSYIKYILARHEDRGFLESKSKVFERERVDDEKDWGAIMGAAKAKMGTTRVTKEHMKQALQTIFMNFGNTNWRTLTYTMEVGWPSPTTGYYTVNITGPYSIKITFRT